MADDRTDTNLNTRMIGRFTHEALPMTNRTRPVSAGIQRIALCLLAAALLMDIGCVSRRAYEQIKAETREYTQTLETVREEVTELDQQVAELQAQNRHEDAIIDEIFARLQREKEQLPIMRQQAEEQHSSLKVQVASLLDQSWHLARQIAEIRQDSTSLQAMAARYKQEMEQAQEQEPLLVASHATKPSITHATTEEEPSDPVVPSAEEIEPPQVAQAVSSPPDLAPVEPSPPSSSVNIEPPTANTVEPPPSSDSWIDIIIGWFLAFWNWLIS